MNQSQLIGGPGLWHGVRSQGETMSKLDEEDERSTRMEETCNKISKFINFFKLQILLIITNEIIHLGPSPQVRKFIPKWIYI